MSCVYRADQRYGAGTIVDAVRGIRSEKIRRLGLDRIKTYGVLKGEDAHFLHDVIHHLVLSGYIEQTDDEYPVIRLTQKSRDVLFGGERLTMKRAKAAPRPAPTEESAPPDAELLKTLKKLRQEIAHKNGVPAFMVFSDAALLDMCRRQPRTAYWRGRLCR
jgi:ATP-dependent DNA helicase RecQ